MASFKGITFSERGEGATTFPAWTREAAVNVVHVPGSNTNVIQSGGLQADTLALEIRCSGAQLASLYVAVGTSGTLSYSYGSRTAFLRSISKAVEVLGSDMYFVTLNFIGM